MNSSSAPSEEGRVEIESVSRRSFLGVLRGGGGRGALGAIVIQ
ncbi:MAG TPA: hypothetical protein VIM09_04645 [Chthoniobacterales bacterium]|jgi:hypothetical protein